MINHCFPQPLEVSHNQYHSSGVIATLCVGSNSLLQGARIAKSVVPGLLRLCGGGTMPSGAHFHARGAPELGMNRRINRNRRLAGDFEAAMESARAFLCDFRTPIDAGAPHAQSSDWGVSALNFFQIMETPVSRLIPPPRRGHPAIPRRWR